MIRHGRRARHSIQRVAVRFAMSLAFAMIGATAEPGRAEVLPPEAYQLHCSGCHGGDGSGDGRIIPSLRELGPLVATAEGRAYLGRVPGVAQAPLDSAELAALLNWVLTTLSGVEDFEPIRPKEIEALRRDPLRDPVAARPGPSKR